jgi:DNA-binding MarR family transcriptional regulator
MENKKILTEKLYKLVTLLAWEMETAWDYGVGFTLNHSETHLLDNIKIYSGANAGELARLMNITNGAVSQITKKLLDKELIESYRMPDNRKEVFFNLTPLGEKVYRGHQKHHDKMNAGFFDYVEGLNESDLRKICDFLDTVIQSIEKVKKP